MGLLDWAQPLVQLGSGIANWFSTQETNKQNYDLQKEEWAREDSSYQRKVEDLKAAGLNPALALGGGAPSSLAVRMAAPSIDAPDMTAPIRMNLARQQAAIAANEKSVSDLQTEYMKKFWDFRIGDAAKDANSASLLLTNQWSNAMKQGELLDAQVRAARLENEFMTQLGAPGSPQQILRELILGKGGSISDLVRLYNGRRFK